MNKESRNKFPIAKVDTQRVRLFEEVVLPHLDAAYNLARWLTRNDQDAQDVVQEAFLRALRSFGSFQRGRDPRPWLLKIVRNTCYTWLRQNRSYETVASSDELLYESVDQDANAEILLMQAADSKTLHQALENIPLDYREALVLRELEGLAYKEIADLLGVPIGTVMSRLSRARRELSRLLGAPAQEARP